MILLYYCQPNLEASVFKNKIISKIQDRLSKSHVFLNNYELVSALFAFVKLGKGDEVFFRLMQDRTILQMETFTLDQIEKIIILFSNKPAFSVPVFKAIEKHLKKNFNKIPRVFLSSIFQTFSEFNYGNPEFLEQIENFLINHIFNMTNSELSKNLWSFSLKNDINSLFFKKAAECIIEKLETYTAKELASFIWGFSNVNYEDKKLYDEIEEVILQKLENNKFSSLRDITSLLWAYVQRVPLRINTVNLMKVRIYEKKDEIQTWDITIILWGLSRFKSIDYEDLFNNLRSCCYDLIEEMNNYELTTTLRIWSESGFGDEQLYGKYIEKIDQTLADLNFDDTIILIYCLTILQKNYSELVRKTLEKLKERATIFKQQIQKIQEPINDGNKKEINFSDVNEYLTNEAIAKIRDQ